MRDEINRLFWLFGLAALGGSIFACAALAWKMDQRSIDQLISTLGVVAGILSVTVVIAVAGVLSIRQIAQIQQSQPMPPQIEVYEPQAKQIAARVDFLDTGRGQLVDSSRVEQMAFQIVHRCKGVEWTYENIKARTGETNNRLIQQGLDLLAARGQVSTGGQGSKRVRTAPQPAEA